MSFVRAGRTGVEKGSEGGRRTDRARRVSGRLEEHTHLQPADWEVGDPEAAGPVASNLFGASVGSTGTVLTVAGSRKIDHCNLL